MDACFDPTGERIAVGTRDGLAAIWKAPLAPTPVPDWFPSFAEAVAGLRLGNRGAMEWVAPGTITNFTGRVAADTTNFYSKLVLRFVETPLRRDVASAGPF